MAAGKINLQANDGYVLGLIAPDGMGADTNDVVATKTNVDAKATLAEAQAYDLGVGQTWQDVTASRSVGVTYTNSTGKPIQISVVSTANAWGVTIDGVALIPGGTYPYAIWVSIVIQNGSTYSLTNGTIGKWLELR